MTNDQMRIAIQSVYRAASWRDKVAKMSDAQVFAIFQRMRAQGRIKI